MSRSAMSSRDRRTSYNIHKSVSVEDDRRISHGRRGGPKSQERDEISVPTRAESLEAARTEAQRKRRNVGEMLNKIHELQLVEKKLKEKDLEGIWKCKR